MPRSIRALHACSLAATALSLAASPAGAADDASSCTMRAGLVAECAFRCEAGQTLHAWVAGIGVEVVATCGGAAAACASSSYCEAHSPTTTLEAGTGTCRVSGAVWYGGCGAE